MKTIAPRQADLPGEVQMETVRLWRDGGWLALPPLYFASLRGLCRIRRLAVLILLFLIPVGLVVFVRTLERDTYTAATIMALYRLEFVVVLVFMPTVLLPLTALFFSASVIQDEIEDQTLTYLLVRPLPRSGIYLVKWLAGVTVAAVLMVTFTVIVEAAIWVGTEGMTMAEWAERLGALLSAQWWALLAYSAIFGFAGLLFRRILIIGAAYILIFEGIIANIPFVIREYTIMYYLRTQLLRTFTWSEDAAKEVQRNWAIDLELTPTRNVAVITLLVLTGIFLALGAYVMATREFRMKTPEGS